jgi:hypothetical protein
MAATPAASADVVATPLGAKFTPSPEPPPQASAATSRFRTLDPTAANPAEASVRRRGVSKGVIAAGAVLALGAAAVAAVVLLRPHTEAPADRPLPDSLAVQGSTTPTPLPSSPAGDPFASAKPAVPAAPVATAAAIPVPVQAKTPAPRASASASVDAPALAAPQPAPSKADAVAAPPPAAVQAAPVPVIVPPPPPAPVKKAVAAPNPATSNRPPSSEIISTVRPPPADPTPQ